MIKRIFILFILVLSVLSGCKKNDETIPNVSVNFTIDVTSIQYTNLQVVGGWVYVTGGVNGIIIRHNDTDQFLAYDRTCPYHASQNNRVQIISSNPLLVIDSVCGSKFSLFDGLPLSGSSAKAPLKSYNADFDGRYLHVYN